jgi:hypothetical protein
LLLALSGTPADSSVVYGGINFPRAESWTSAVPFPVATRLIGNNTEQNRAWPGTIFDLSVPEVGPADVPSFALQARSFTHQRNVADAKNHPTNNLATVFSSGKLIIAKFGATAHTTVCAFRAELQFGGPVEPDWCINDTNDYGISGWSRVQGAPSIVATLGRDVVPPAAMTAATWKEAVENNDDTDNDVHVFVVFGGSAGRTVCAYLPYAFATAHEWVSENGLGYQKVTLTAKDGQYVVNSENSTMLCELFQG